MRNFQRTSILLALHFFCIGSVFYCSTGSCSANDIFLEFEGSGLQGESTATGKERQNDLLTWDWATLPGDPSGTLSISKYVNTSSAALLRHALTGQTINKATVTVRKQGGEKPEFITIEMERIHIINVSSSASKGGEGLVEQVTLKFGKVSFTYVSLDPKTNQPAGETKFVWDYDLQRGEP